MPAFHRRIQDGMAEEIGQLPMGGSGITDEICVLPDTDLDQGLWDTEPTPGGNLWQNVDKTVVDDSTWIEVTL